MARKILIIGGTRFFGKRLVRRLLDRGDDVTLATRGRTGDEFGDRVRRAVVDRRDGAALRRLAAARDHDVVIDQVCYTPLDARRSVEAFAGRAGRYVMSSTIEVYRSLVGTSLDHRAGSFAEDDLSFADQDALDDDARWDDPAWAERRYGDGKRRAEAWFARDGRLPVAAVRIAHVLGGADDFTGRLAAHVRAVREGRPLALAAPSAGATSFIDPDGIAAFLAHVADLDATGAINAASNGALDAATLHLRVGAVLGLPADVCRVTTACPEGFASPFDVPSRFALDTGRARALGHRFGAVDDWLAATIRALAGAAQPEWTS